MHLEDSGCKKGFHLSYLVSDALLCAYIQRPPILCSPAAEGVLCAIIYVPEFWLLILFVRHLECLPKFLKIFYGSPTRIKSQNSGTWLHTGPAPQPQDYWGNCPPSWSPSPWITLLCGVLQWRAVFVGCIVVYRGCADARNLPLDVDSSVQCREQGRLPAVWWFCNGTLCNSEQFSAVCGDGSSNGNSGQLTRFICCRVEIINFKSSSDCKALEPDLYRLLSLYLNAALTLWCKL